MNIDREDAKHMVGKGWSKIIDYLYDNLEIPEKIRVFQVKEKFGTLRFYTSGTTKEEDVIIRNAEKMSGETCEQCGEPGTVKKQGYWLTCLCQDCFGIEEQHMLAARKENPK